MFNLNALVRHNILKMQPYASARDEYTGSDGVFVDANENPFGSLNRYPDPKQQVLKKKVSELKFVRPETVFLGNGSDEIIDLCVRIFCEPAQDAIMTFTPTYGMYEVSAAINDVKMITVPLDKDFQIDIAATIPLLSNKNLKIIFICSPNNPTGNLMDAAEFIIKNFEGIVVLDEAYIEFSKSTSLKEKIGDYPNLIVLQTFSKLWGLAAARIGIAISNPEIIGLLNKVKPPYNISALNQQAALDVIVKKPTIMRQREIILTERKLMIGALMRLKIVKQVYPSDANFILTEVVDADAVYQKLLDRQIVVRNRTAAVANCLRITIGSPNENKKLIKALQDLTL